MLAVFEQPMVVSLKKMSYVNRELYDKYRSAKAIALKFLNGRDSSQIRFLKSAEEMKKAMELLLKEAHGN